MISGGIQHQPGRSPSWTNNIFPVDGPTVEVPSKLLRRENPSRDILANLSDLPPNRTPSTMKLGRIVRIATLLLGYMIMAYKSAFSFVELSSSDSARHSHSYSLHPHTGTERTSTHTLTKTTTFWNATDHHTGLTLVYSRDPGERHSRASTSTRFMQR